jgi:uncharacterized protein (TIRG00374 family)
MVDAGALPERSALRRWARLGLMAGGAIALYGLLPQVLDTWEEAPRIGAIGWAGLAAMVVFEVLSMVSVWRLHRVAAPDLTWFAAGTTQLTANAVSKAVPGGAAVGAGVTFRMWRIAGVDTGPAAGALAATSVISSSTLFALPIVSLVVAALGAPVPRNMFLVAVGAAVVAVVLFGSGTAVLASDRVARRVASATARVAALLTRHRGPTAEQLLRRRAELVAALGPRWRTALLASVANWGFDHLALVAALVFLDTDPRFSVVLLAYGAAAVLAMIPITPGGLGFVEAGLASLLVLAGVPAADALLATLAYRIVSFWLPLPAGLVAWLLFRRRHRPPIDLSHLAAEASHDADDDPPVTPAGAP